MKRFTIERTYSVPHYRHVTYEAETLEDAIRQDELNDNWDSQKTDFDSSSEEIITGAWQGAHAYSGADLVSPAELCKQRQAFDPITGRPADPC